MSGLRQHRAVRLELGRRSYAPGEFPPLGRGAVVRLQERVEDPVNVYADGCLLARGQLTLRDGRVGVRITEVLAAPGDSPAGRPPAGACAYRDFAADFGRDSDLVHRHVPRG